MGSPEEVVAKLNPLLAAIAEDNDNIQALLQGIQNSLTNITTLLSGQPITLPAPPTSVVPILVTITAPPPGAPPVPPVPVVIGGPLPLPVIPLPRGTIHVVADLNPTTASFQTVVAYTVTQGKTFNLAKIVASCNSGYEVQLYWKGKAITVIYKQAGGSVLTDWFPVAYPDLTLTPLMGDGSSQLVLQGRFPSGGTADDLWGEIVGEEV
jgi:hypothetical protein